MKKMIKRIIIALTIFTAGFFTSYIIIENASRKVYLEENTVDNQVVFTETIDYTEIKIINKTAFSKKEISVTEDMIVTNIDTRISGTQTLVIEYGGKKFEVEVEVRFKVEFVVDGDVIDTQLVLSKQDIIMPANPVKEGFNFLYWSGIPETLMSNIKVEAVFGSNDYSVPALKNINAEYGDCLNSITLPSNEYGSWVFVDNVDTPVGAPGTNSFDVKFVPNDSVHSIIYKTVKIDVSKKKIDFINVVDTFIYDGKEHKPEYELSLDVNVSVDYYGNVNSAVSSSDYVLQIVDDFYEGIYYGTLKINKCPIQINVQSYEIFYGEAVPTIQWQVTGLPTGQDVGVSLVPLGNTLNAGEYELNVTIDNENYEATIKKGTLKIKKIILEVGNPDFETDAVYGNVLSTVQFKNDFATGLWSWNNPEEIIDNPGSFTAKAIFTPNDVANYEIIERDLLLTVTKRSVAINIVNNSFEYDGNPHCISYTIDDGSLTDISLKYFIDSVEFDGTKIDAGVYRIKMELDDLRYQGFVYSDLTILKAQNEITELSIEGWEYGNLANQPTASSRFNSDSISYIYSTEENGVYSEEVPTNVGTYYAKAKSLGTSNYVSCEKITSFTITKRKVDVKWVLAESYTYTGSIFTLPTASFRLADGINDYSLKVSMDKEEFKNAGMYTFTASISVLDTDILNNYTINNEVKEITVLKATAEITGLTIVGWTYGETAKEPTANTNLGSIAYTYSSTLTGTYTDTVPTNAGTYYVKASVLETENYTGYETEAISFTISKKSVSVIWNVGSYTYTGDELIAPTASIKLVDETDYELKVSTTKDFINAGDYKFTAEFTDPVIGNNYELTNDTYDVIVNKKEVVAPVIANLLYTGAHQAPSISDTGLYTVIENAGGTDAGTYYVVLQLIDFTNYKWSSSTEATIEISYDIYLNKNVWITDPFVDNVTYGTELSPKMGEATSGVDSISVIYIYPDGSRSSEKPTDAGNYTAVFTAAAEGYNTITYSVDFSILQAKYTPITPSGLTAQYGDLISSIVIETTDEGTWSLVNEKLSFDSVGTVTMKAQFIPTNTNYYSDPIDVEIVVSKRLVSISIIKDEFIYNGSVQKLEYKVYDGENELLGFDVLGNTGLTDAGSISQTLTINSEYYQGSITHTLTITKQIVDVINIQSKEYTGEVLTADIEESTLYSVTENIGGTNVGLYNVVLTLKDSNNYKWNTTELSSIELSFEITKGKATISNFNIVGWTYGETAKAPTANTNLGSIVYTYSSTRTGTYTNIVPTNAGTYYVKASVIGTDNYYGDETEAISFTIAKATPTVVWPEYNNTNYEDRFNPETDYSNTPSTNGTFIFDEIIYSDTFNSSITITVTFKPTDSINYLELTKTITVTMSPVAYIGSTNYGTVEKALNAAVSGNTVYVIIGTNPIIKANCYIKSGVTLALPYDGTTTINRNGTAATFGDENATLIATNLKTNMTINDGVTLIIESGGTLTIGGVLGHEGVGVSAQTSGSYCQITLGANSKIASEGTINCFGFIKENSLNNGSQVVCTSGNVNMPFVVYDFRGGTSTTASYQKGGIAPFNVYDMPNIQSIFTLHSNATLTAYVDLYASSKHNTSTATIISNSSGLLILNSGSYVTFKYTPEKFGYTTKLGRTNVKIYGGAKTGSMSMNVSIATVNTANVLFGISWKFDYELYSGIYTINNQYKFMTGSSLFVNSDATLNVAGTLMFYQSFTDVSYGGYVYPSKSPARFIMNGTLNINGSFGGVVETTADGAVMNVSSSATLHVSSKEGHGEGNALSNSFVLVATISESFKGYPYGINKLNNFAAGTYYSKDEHWYSEFISIFYETNGGDIVSPSEGPYQINENGYTLNNINVADPTKAHYTFGGWYIDRELTEAVGGQKVYTSIYVFAKWIPIEYNITYQNVFENCSEEEITNTNLSTYNIESYFTLTTPTSATGLTFIGWFSDASCTQVINAIDGSLYGSNITIYGLWNPAGTSKYTVNIITNNTDYDDEVIYFFETKPEAFILPDYVVKNTDKEYSKYFLGFYIDDENTLVTREYIVANIVTLSTDNELTIYGKWVDKYKITLKDVFMTLFVYNQTVTLPSAPDYDDFTDNTDYILRTQKYWLANGTDYYYADGKTTFTATGDTEFELTTKATKYYLMEFTLSNASVTVNATNGIVEDTSGSIVSSITPSSGAKLYILEGAEVSFSISYSQSDNNYSIKPTNGTELTGSGTSASFVMVGTTYKVNISSEASSCLVEGALIKMADGTYKKIEDIKANDMVLVFNHYTGSFDVSVVIYNVHSEDPYQYYDIVTLYFDDGSTLKIHNSHYLLDAESRKYELLTNDNISSYIGHSFYKLDDEGSSLNTVKLVSYEIKSEYTRVFGPITYQHLNCFADGFLNLPGDNDPFINIFELDNTLKYDEELMQNDIDTYGLFTYDDFKDYISEDIYNAYCGQYLKVAIGKGYTSFERIIELVNYYLVDLGYQ